MNCIHGKPLGSDCPECQDYEGVPSWRDLKASKPNKNTPSMARPKQDDIPGVEGPGVSPPKIKELDRLGDKYVEIRDEKAKLAGKLGDVERKMAEIMVENGISKYQWSDQEIIVKPGKTHVVVKTVKAEGVEVDPDDEP